MKKIYLLSTCFVMLAMGCSKIIDVKPLSNLYDETYYQNKDEIKVALTGCYYGMQKPLLEEWKMTELRSDNSIMGSPTSGSSTNRDLSDLDIFTPNTSHTGIYNYWLSTYYNIYNTNKVLNSLGVHYHPDNGTLTYDSISIPVSMEDRKSIAAEASFIRAHHYFNLVRLFGGVFLIHQPVTLQESKLINRSSAADIYKLIEADLANTISYGNQNTFSTIGSSDIGRANVWSGKALLAKVYLTLNRKTESANLLRDIISNGGYSLQSKYANVFSINNEMNSEILFSVRYKSGTVGLGSPFANLFAASSSGNAVVNGDGDGLNYPALELKNTYATIKRVQKARGNTALLTPTSFNVSFSVAPTNGNTLVAVISSRTSTPNNITSITQTGVTWSRATQALNPNGVSTEIWIGTNVNSAANQLTINQGASKSAAIVMEYSGVDVNNPIEMFAGNNANGAAFTAGSLTNRVFYDAFVGGIGLENSKHTVSGIGTPFSYVYVDSSRTTSFDLNAKLYAYESFTDIPKTYTLSGNISVPSNWAGALIALKAGDSRKDFNIRRYITKDYANKYISDMIVANDGENDWPVIRYADVLLMLAEAEGFTPSSIALINQIHQRAGLPALSAINSVAAFEQALSQERRLEFAFENQRWFDIVRFNTTMSTLTAEQIMKAHFAYMYPYHYGDYPAPAYTLSQLQSFITPEHLLLPIPQREIDNNTTIQILQNPGY